MIVQFGKYLYLKERTASSRGWHDIVGDGSSTLPSRVVRFDQGLLAIQSQLQHQRGD
jgi:hypothetical protein